MFNLFRKKIPVTQGILLPIDTDLHSHILPGLDDGSPNLETSLRLIRGLQAMGIKKTIATPHIIGDLYRNNASSINHALRLTQTAIRQHDIDIEISAAAEYMLDDYFLGLLKNEERLLMVKDDLLLTEMPYTSPPHDLEEIAFEIITRGYKPVLAHPERYAYYHKNYKEFHRLKGLGFLLQVNLLSIPGYYGTAVSKAAHYLLDKGLADLVGSDLHHERHLHSLNSSLGKIAKALQGKKILNLRGEGF